VRRVDDRGHLWLPNKTSVICSQHFQEDAFMYQFGRKTVKPGALPTIFSFTQEVPKRKAPKCRSVPAGPTTSTCTSETISVVEQSDMASSVDKSAQSSTLVGENSGGGTYVKTFHSYCVKSPTKLRKENDVLRRKLAAKVGALRNVRKREARLKGRVANLLEDLRRNRLLTEQAGDLLEAYKDIPLHLFQHVQKGKSFTSEQQQFASTLYYYSAAAYAYVRNKIPSLPNPRTIRRWLSVFDGKPGLTEESFLRIKARNESEQSCYRICALTIDEMEIKKQIETDRHGKVHGFQDLGCGPLDDDSHPQATKALVVLGVGLSGHWKLPLGYLLTNGASADLQASLLNAVLSKLSECGCIGVSVTFDGLAADQKTLTKLGGCLRSENVDSFFPHPCDSEI